jgi:hypothetical protein
MLSWLSQEGSKNLQIVGKMSLFIDKICSGEGAFAECL